MKRVLISFILLILAFSFCFVSFSLLNKDIMVFDKILNECIVMTEEESYAKSSEKIQQAAEFWQKKENRFKFLIDLNLCRSIENCLESVTFFISEKEYTDAKSSINECRDILKQITENESFSVDIIL